MRRIEVLDKAAEAGIKYRDINVNATFGAAYFTSVDAENDLPDFSEVIWDHDIDEILENMSSTFSSLIETIAELEKRGCNLEGLVEINSRYDDWQTGEKKKVPAFKMTIN